MQRIAAYMLVALTMWFQAPAFAQDKIEGNEIPSILKTDKAIESEKSSKIPEWLSRIKIGGYLQLWWILTEDNENGKLQAFTLDEAAQETSGFSFNRARLTTEMKREHVRAKLELGLEGSPRLLDAYGAWKPQGLSLEVLAGQMKIPSTYEVNSASSNLDFATRSKFSDEVVNWSLSRGPTVSSPIYGIKAYLRDTGIAAKGKAGPCEYHAMIGNGLGANLWVGGNEKRQYMYANDPGAYFYGVRLSCDFSRFIERNSKAPFFKKLTIGGHFNGNYHPNLIFKDEKTVLDIERESWSVDFQLNIMGRLRFTWMTGRGIVLDDFDNDDKIDYIYFGTEFKLIYVILPEQLEIGIRYDTYTEEFFENGSETAFDTYTFGATYTIKPDLRFQLNYKIKDLESRTAPDIDDNILLLTAQLNF